MHPTTNNAASNWCKASEEAHALTENTRDWGHEQMIDFWRNVRHHADVARETFLKAMAWLEQASEYEVTA